MVVFGLTELLTRWGRWKLRPEEGQPVMGDSLGSEDSRCRGLGAERELKLEPCRGQQWAIRSAFTRLFWLWGR